ncbi:PREDICTED: neurofilament medium polypeptide-like [Priapulus caudatus]|uniref:Neurofilament medium polypeptide-like n=1 Tax=Priapulus caudatus TaxID=37621 RepID=A0ABM1ETJ3_PRICU|nr:PREDICTED: neurofilament medium polypeptide-like [Priapulus caudatus]
MSKRQNQPGGGSGGGGDDDDTTKASTELSVHTTTAERGYEKEQLQDLNERFARYLEEVYFLTFFNKKLTSDVGFYKTKVERLEAVLRAVYEEELRQAKEVVEECREEAGRLGAKSERLENDAADLRERHAILVEGPRPPYDDASSVLGYRSRNA